MSTPSLLVVNAEDGLLVVNSERVVLVSAVGPQGAGGGGAASSPQGIALSSTLSFTAANSLTVAGVGANAANNGTALRAACTTALALADDKVYVLVPPGSYDLNEFVLDLTGKALELIGTTANARDHYLFGYCLSDETAPCMIRLHAEGGLRNLYIQNQSTGALDGNYRDMVAVGFSGTLVSNYPEESIWVSIHRGELQNVLLEAAFGRVICMGGEYAGKYVNVYGARALLFCSGILSGYFRACGSGAENVLIGPVASGTFIDCYGGSYSFGATTMTGKWINCRGGVGSFGGEPEGEYVTNAPTPPSFDSCVKLGGAFSQAFLGDTLGAHFHECLEMSATVVSVNPI